MREKEKNGRGGESGSPQVGSRLRVLPCMKSSANEFERWFQCRAPQPQGARLLPHRSKGQKVIGTQFKTAEAGQREFIDHGLGTYLVPEDTEMKVVIAVEYVVDYVSLHEYVS